MSRCDNRTVREKFEAFIQKYSEGGTARQAREACQLRAEDFYAHLRANPADRQRYYDVQRDRADMMVDEAYTISTDDALDHRRARVQAEVRMKIAGMFDRSRFGERVDVNVSGQVDMLAALAEAKARVTAPPRHPAIVQDAEYTELPALNAPGTLACEASAPADPTPMTETQVAPGDD